MSFKETLESFKAESLDIQKRQAQLEVDTKLHLDKLHGFLKSQGLPENFTLAELALLAVEKAST